MKNNMFKLLIDSCETKEQLLQLLQILKIEESEYNKGFGSLVYEEKIDANENQQIEVINKFSKM